MKKIKITIMNVVPYQTCPKCNGQGTVSRPPWIDGDVLAWSSSAVGNYQCDVCNGQKIIPMHIVVSDHYNKVIEETEETHNREHIDKMACENWGITEEILNGKNRNTMAVEARKAIMFYRKMVNNETYKAIASDYGLKHSTALNHVKEMPDLIRFNKDIRERVKDFFKMLDANLDYVLEFTPQLETQNSKLKTVNSKL